MTETKQRICFELLLIFFLLLDLHVKKVFRFMLPTFRYQNLFRRWDLTHNVDFSNTLFDINN